MGDPDIRLLDGEKIIMTLRPIPSYLYYRLVQTISYFIIAVALLSLSKWHLALYYNALFSNALVEFAVSVAIILILAGFILYPLLKKSIDQHWTVITNQRCVIYQGFINLNRRTLALDKVIDAYLKQDILARYLNLCGVIIVQPGTINFVPGLSMQQADELIHLLSDKMTRTQK